jgi:hypothetical protein
MRWRAKKQYKHHEWRPWFTWFPVRIGDHKVWLEMVMANCVSENPFHFHCKLEFRHLTYEETARWR